MDATRPSFTAGTTRNVPLASAARKASAFSGVSGRTTRSGFHVASVSSDTRGQSPAAVGTTFVKPARARTSPTNVARPATTGGSGQTRTTAVRPRCARPLASAARDPRPQRRDERGGGLGRADRGADACHVVQDAVERRPARHEDVHPHRGEFLPGRAVRAVPRDDDEVGCEKRDALEVGCKPPEPDLPRGAGKVAGEVTHADDARRGAEGEEDFRGRGREGDDAPGRSGGGDRGGEEGEREEEPAAQDSSASSRSFGIPSLRHAAAYICRAAFCAF